jgi:hypothetical protein
MSVVNPTIVEKRFSRRHKARTEVRIRTGGKSKLCKAVNLSSEGVAIQTTDMSLKKGESVELTFIINLGIVSKMHRRKARVIYVKNGVTGFSMLSFNESQPHRP